MRKMSIVHFIVKEIGQRMAHVKGNFFFFSYHRKYRRKIIQDNPRKEKSPQRK